MSIDPYGSKPVYLQLADLIADKITAGELKSDRPVPGERRMAEEYGVAHLTVRRAMRELRERGLVVTVHGKGTYVAPRE